MSCIYRLPFLSDPNEVAPHWLPPYCTEIVVEEVTLSVEGSKIELHFRDSKATSTMHTLVFLLFWTNLPDEGPYAST